ncbi:DUF2167 domain-containing protein [Sediminicola sp. 1XM1-17]|uniref:DUF2167 domain-containing protein n=1 Tax=Sediminicola sp. 1XM1-17 TaxID=3127702 RepID=UPI0030778850
MKTFALMITCLFVFQIVQSQTEEEVYQAAVDSLESTFHYEYGMVNLKDGLATLQVPKGYKYLGPEESSYVLTELWGNPPSEVIGLLFPEEISPISDNFTYAVEITYSEDGYIEDGDADDLDYDDLLEEMQNDAKQSNKERKKLGYGSVELIGWASPPFYDTMNKKLHWAKELKFEGEMVNTLNYNIRILGRRGYLTLNAIGHIEVLPLFNRDREQILASVDFNDGNRYQDFDADYDDVAAYGLGGLIAGKVLAKVGFFALLLKFWKFLALGAVGLFSVFRKKLFGDKRGQN